MGTSVENGASIKLEGIMYKATIVCFILGVGTLIGWTSLLTIQDYYYKQFPRYHPSRVLALFFQLFALITSAILAYHEAKINTRLRNIWGFIMFFVGTLFLLILDLATSGKGGIGPYICICAISAIYGVACALVFGGMMGDLSLMCPEFIQSFVAGNAASGAIASTLRLLTKAVFEKSHNGLGKGAILFLAISTFLEFLCIFLYAIYYPKLPIVVYYRKKAALEGSNTVSADLAAAGIKKEENQDEVERFSNKQLLLQNIDYALEMFLISAMTMSIFPGFLYENTGPHHLGAWYHLVLVAMFNIWDFISNYFPVLRFLKMESRMALMVAVLARFLLVPAFYFTAKYGQQGWMILLTSFLGLSHGYLTVCVMTVAPKPYKGPEQNALGNLLVLCSSCGFVVGVVLNWLWLIGKPKAT